MTHKHLTLTTLSIAASLSMAVNADTDLSNYLGAQNVALAGATISTASSVDALFVNPAGLYSPISGSNHHVMLSDDTYQNDGLLYEGNENSLTQAYGVIGEHYAGGFSVIERGVPRELQILSADQQRSTVPLATTAFAIYFATGGEDYKVGGSIDMVSEYDVSGPVEYGATFGVQRDLFDIGYDTQALSVFIKSGVGAVYKTEVLKLDKDGDEEYTLRPRFVDLGGHISISLLSDSFNSTLTLMTSLTKQSMERAHYAIQQDGSRAYQSEKFSGSSIGADWTIYDFISGYDLSFRAGQKNEELVQYNSFGIGLRGKHFAVDFASGEHPASPDDNVSSFSLSFFFKTK